jgi:hypothetical protein
MYAATTISKVEPFKVNHHSVMIFCEAMIFPAIIFLRFHQSLSVSKGQ